ncbi:MAG: nicotinic acid mononucleotide adenylyltransferase, partial [Gemmatimonadota bacterium]|nr:nicotinic acid mononucleotide adenylyltransferase [Gemmatimonadota bacterium]
MRIGVFGGSFDPPHVGHFLAAVDAAERLTLDRV